jgi:AraC-like DNA-binding protein
MSRGRHSNSLAPSIAALATREGLNATRSPDVVLWRMTVGHPPTPTLYGASLIVVGAGEKRATFANQTFTYDSDHLLIVTAPLPMLCQTIASPLRPVLTMVVSIDLPSLRHLVALAPPAPARTTAEPRPTVARLRLTKELEATSARLLRHLGDRHRATALAPDAIRELLYLVLESPQGGLLRAAAEGTSRQLRHVLRHLNENFAKRMAVDDMARLARMSLPTFHQRFREATGATPLQYMKTLRLTRARQMLREGDFVKTVARAIGYESESQFSREYRRFFGAPPSHAACHSPR